MALVQVVDVSVTSGHHIGKQNSATSIGATKTPGDHRTIVKFSPNKTSCNIPNPKIAKDKLAFLSPSPLSSKAKGKRKAKESNPEETDDESQSESEPSDSD
ncbi:hypothetical protein PtB15_17B22 [Puccinia triticina]|nr:hypothetical protein PtB15_17B22 [Puccinia triticina]